MVEQAFVTESGLAELVRQLASRGEVYGPLEKNGAFSLARINPAQAAAVSWPGYRTADPFRPIVFQLLEKVSGYFGPDEPTHEKPVSLLGVRACDLSALQVYDRVLAEGQFSDPYYQARRQKLFLVGTDCTACGASCFCTMVGGRPYATASFDLNIVPLKNGFLVEIGSDRGAKFKTENATLFAAPTGDQLAEKDQQRARTEQLVKDSNQRFTCRCNIDWREAHRINLENQKAWRQLTKDCVECSSCNLVCPSCTCFLLVDQKESAGGSRYKEWDACLKNGYARVAGGANSRPKLFERLQNRYHCKFDYSYTRLGRYTCVGCGRCIDGCAGNIDMRQVYAELVRQVPLSAKLE